MKKGISPIVSWVLIISFSVAIAMVVVPTLIDRAKEFKLDPNIDYCDDVSISIKDICKLSDGVLRITVNNNGGFSIQEVTIGRTTNSSSEQWCSYSSISDYFPLIPGDTSLIELSLGEQFVFDITQESFTVCSNVDLGENLSAVEIAIVPWVRPDPESEIIHCDDKKVIWDDTNILNTPCV